MRPSSDARRRAPSAVRRPVFAVASAVVALLLFCWPFLRVPRLHIVHAYLHLFGAWAAVIVVLWLMARRLGDDEREREGRGDRAP